MPKFSAQAIRALRTQRHLTREALAATSGLAYGSVMKLEQGSMRPSVTTLGKLTDALKCEIGDLFTGDDDADLRPTDLGPEIDAWIAKTLATAPPMSPEAARRVSAALFGGAA